MLGSQGSAFLLQPIRSPSEDRRQSMVRGSSLFNCFVRGGKCAAGLPLTPICSHPTRKILCIWRAHITGLPPRKRLFRAPLMNAAGLQEHCIPSGHKLPHMAASLLVCDLTLSLLHSLSLSAPMLSKSYVGTTRYKGNPANSQYNLLNYISYRRRTM